MATNMTPAGSGAATLRPPSPVFSTSSSVTKAAVPSINVLSKLDADHLKLESDDLERAQGDLSDREEQERREEVDEVFPPGEESPDEIEREKADPFLVVFDDHDPANPKEWRRWFRWYITLLGGLLTLNSTFSSSAPSGIIPQLIEDFNMSDEVATLLIAVFVLGYCFGPLLWGPLSESYGRRPIFIFAFFFYTVFQVAAAVAPNTAALVVFRLLGGVFAASPLANAGALLADIWDAETRGKAMAFFVLAPFAGPALGPIVSGFMQNAGVDWHWLFWVLTMFAGACFVLIIFTLPETFAPVLLASKAKAIRIKTGELRYYAAIERADLHWRQRVSNILGRPFKVMFLEPMLIAITLYMSFVYGCIYLLFEAFPIVYTEGHNMSEGISGLMFLPLFLGGATGVVMYMVIFSPRYTRYVRQYEPALVPPEYRLEMALVGGPLFAIGFFWFGWTSFPSISFWSPLFATLFLGIGVILIFLSLFNYIIDAYLMVAASALSSSTVVRSAFGAGFPLFATQMFDKLDPRWASTLLGCFAVLMVPIPFVLKRYGHIVRRNSRYAPTL